MAGRSLLWASIAWLVLVASTITEPAQAQPSEKRVRIWIQAFIPAEHPTNPGYIRRAENGTFVIAAPENPLLDFIGVQGSCFATDSRGFSTSSTSSSRIAIEKIFVVRGRDIIRTEDPAGRQPIRTGSTKNVNCSTGALLSEKTASTDGTSISSIHNGNFVSSVGITSKTANPFYPSLVSPKIDIDAVVERRFLKRDIRIYGAVGVFPAFEAYYSIDDGPSLRLFTLSPEPGTTAFDLIDLGTGFKTRNFEAIIPLP